MGERTDVKQLAADINAAVELQYRSVLAYAVAAGTLPGAEGVALSGELRRLAAEALNDLERLAERVTTLGGVPATDVPKLKAARGWRATVHWLIAAEREALDAVVAAIPAKADDAEGEASEHPLEHVVERKRNAVALLERALR